MSKAVGGILIGLALAAIIYISVKRRKCHGCGEKKLPSDASVNPTGTIANMPVNDLEGNNIGTTNATGEVVAPSGSVVAAVGANGTALDINNQPVGQVVAPPAADGSNAVTAIAGAVNDAAPAPAETTTISYIKPIATTDGSAPSKIEVGVTNQILQDGDQTQITHPNVNGLYNVSNPIVNADGSGSVVIDAPPANTDGSTDLATGGTISVIAANKSEAAWRKILMQCGLARGLRKSALSEFIRRNAVKYNQN